MSSPATRTSSSDAAGSDVLVLRTRPTTVEARRVTVENRDSILNWINVSSSAWPYGTRALTWYDPGSGLHDAFTGDWVVKTAFGEFIRVPDEKLFSRYESVVTVVSE